MKLLLFILLLPIFSFSQVSVIKVTAQRPIFEEKVIYGARWPTWNKNESYGNPDTRLSFSTMGYDAFWNQTKGPRTFYTNISENQRISRGDSIRVISGGGSKYIWNTGDTTRTIKVSPLNTTTYSVTITDDNRSKQLSTTVYVEDRPLSPKTLNVGNDRTICEGTTITLTSDVEETPTTTYLWSTGATSKSITVTPSLSNTYTVTVTDNEIVLVDEILIIIKKCN